MTTKKNRPKKPRIILFDLETLPDMKEVMEIFPSLSNYPGLTMKASINSIICVGWKVYGEKKTNCISAWDYPKRWAKDVNDDYEVVKAAYDILIEADAVVTHNGKRFDWKFFQTRLLYHGFAPLPKIVHIDTCSESKRHLLSFNNSLKILSKLLTGSKKMENGGWKLWVDVMARDLKAQDRMRRYCMQDVRVLEKLFKRLLPLIKTLPNHNLFSGETHSCPACGSFKTQKRGHRITKTRRYQRYQCQSCGSCFTENNKMTVNND